MSTYSFTIGPTTPTPSAPSGAATGGQPAASAVAGLLGSWDFLFDPITLDLIDDGAGSFEVTTTAATAVQHQLLCHYDRWWGDADLGSRFYNLDLFITDPERLVVDECQRALGVLVQAGRIADVTAVAAESFGRIDVRTSFRDAQSGQPVDFAITPSGA